MKSFNCRGYTLTISNFSRLKGGRRVHNGDNSTLLLYFQDGTVDKVTASDSIIDELFNQVKACF